VLYDPELHEPLAEETWDEGRVRDAIGRIVADADAAFERRGFGRYLLWTGDVGVALYAADRIDGVGRYPVLESWD
jgi:hypothetical protein